MREKEGEVCGWLGDDDDSTVVIPSLCFPLADAEELFPASEEILTFYNEVKVYLGAFICAFAEETMQGTNP